MGFFVREMHVWRRLLFTISVVMGVFIVATAILYLIPLAQHASTFAGFGVWGVAGAALASAVAGICAWIFHTPRGPSFSASQEARSNEARPAEARRDAPPTASVTIVDNGPPVPLPKSTRPKREASAQPTLPRPLKTPPAFAGALLAEKKDVISLIEAQRFAEAETRLNELRAAGDPEMVVWCDMQQRQIQRKHDRLQ